MNAAKLTLTLIIVVVFVGCIYDVWVASTYGGGATISWVVYSMSCKYPALPFAAGFLCGHLFATMRGTPE